ncbi:homeobox-leucine zipper protein HOX32 [Triticum aestivum]|uniref:homeobox-leucine zipper protein HOX32 n=1 Tax=Triticum aestivum TaxID=4565 RepID=UPI001D03097C|nr:homeobox-leucine zipper protein HOX32-like [Triticum aestivum]
MAVAPSGPGGQSEMKNPPGSPDAPMLARFHTGAELLCTDSQSADASLKALWQDSDSIICCSLKAAPVFSFANQVGLDMSEAMLIALQVAQDHASGFRVPPRRRVRVEQG